MPHAPHRERHSTNIIKDALGDLKRQVEAVLPDSAVWIEKGFFTDTYFDNTDRSKANVLNDGPWGFDNITCHNGATPNTSQVRQALTQLQAAHPISENSTLYAFNGENPIAAACAIAPRPARGR